MQYTTDDGQTFSTLNEAEEHEARVQRVQAFLDAAEISDTKTHAKRRLIVDYLRWSEQQ